MTACAASVPTEKSCNRCGRPKPLDQFRRVRTGVEWPRHSECRECRNRQDRKRKERARRSRIGRAFARLS